MGIRSSIYGKGQYSWRQKNDFSGLKAAVKEQEIKQNPPPQKRDSFETLATEKKLAQLSTEPGFESKKWSPFERAILEYWVVSTGFNEKELFERLLDPTVPEQSILPSSADDRGIGIKDRHQEFWMATRKYIASRGYINPPDIQQSVSNVMLMRRGEETPRQALQKIAKSWSKELSKALKRPLREVFAKEKKMNAKAAELKAELATLKKYHDRKENLEKGLGDVGIKTGSFRNVSEKRLKKSLEKIEDKIKWQNIRIRRMQREAEPFVKEAFEASSAIAEHRAALKGLGDVLNPSEKEYSLRDALFIGRIGLSVGIKGTFGGGVSLTMRAIPEKETGTTKFIFDPGTGAGIGVGPFSYGYGVTARSGGGGAWSFGLPWVPDWLPDWFAKVYANAGKIVSVGEHAKFAGVFIILVGFIDFVYDDVEKFGAVGFGRSFKILDLLGLFQLNLSLSGWYGHENMMGTSKFLAKWLVNAIEKLEGLSTTTRDAGWNLGVKLGWDNDFVAR